MHIYKRIDGFKMMKVDQTAERRDKKEIEMSPSLQEALERGAR